VNSQAALFLGDDGAGFIHGVNSIRDLPYLPILELAILGFPIFVHMAWGVQYLLTAKPNSYGRSGTTSYLAEYPRNHAYTWQRITAWILVLAILAHIIHMRFIEYPSSAKVGTQNYYMVRVGLDDGLYTVAGRLDVELFDEKNIQLQKTAGEEDLNGLRSWLHNLSSSLTGIYKNEAHVQKLQKQQNIQQGSEWLKAMEHWPLKQGEAVAVSKDFGTAELLMLRETFKSPIMIALYTVFVITACFHAFNGLWTFLITWGVTLTARSQLLFTWISYGLMFVVSLLGLSAIWLTYWVNLNR